MDNPKLLVIDGHSVVVRAWFAIPASLTNVDGVDTRGALGFFNTFFKTLRNHAPSHVAVAFDTRAPTFRDELFADYKAHRPPMDPELHAQIPIVKKVLKAMRVPIFEQDGFEADDVIGTLAKQATDQGLETLILTGDTDQLQLVSDTVRTIMYSGFGNVRVYDSAAVRERFGGLEPEQVAHLKALEGDKSDNIPGVAGVGRKTAQILLLKFDTVRGVFENLSDVSQIENLRGAKRVQERLQSSEKAATDSLKLATIVCDVPLEFESRKARFGDYIRTEVVDALLGFEMRSIVRQLPKLDQPDQPPQPPIDPQFDFESHRPPQAHTIKIEHIVVDTPSKLGQLVGELNGCDEFAFDTETDGLNPAVAKLVGISFATRPAKGWYVPLGHTEGKQLPTAEVLDALRKLFEGSDKAKIGHNANFDMTALGAAGIKVANLGFDTLIAAVLCGRRAIGLKQLALDILGHEMTPISELLGSGRNQVTMSQVEIEKTAAYAAADAVVTFNIKQRLEQELKTHAQVTIFNDLELPLLPVIVAMQLRGMLLNRTKLEAMSGPLEDEMQILRQALTTLMDGREININSPRQVATLLIDELGAPRTRKTKTGWSMDANALERYATMENINPTVAQIASGILKYRELAKLNSTYVEALPKLINPASGRIHTSFNQVGSTTGRLSSTDPNIQNIPVRTKLGRRVRAAFEADADNGWELLSVDYSQIELRILAHLSDEQGLLDAFRQGEDIHSSTAKTMYGVERPNAEQRRVAKVLNFGVIYGLGAQGIARQTNLSVAEGRRFIDLYFGKYGGIKEYIQTAKQQAHRRGYVETILGRRRYLPDLRATNRGLVAAAERVAVNMPIQGTAADIVKRAMIRIQKQLDTHKYLSKMVVQVHDELIFEVAPNEKKRVEKLATTIMPHAMELKVPLEIAFKSGINWGELKP